MNILYFIKTLDKSVPDKTNIVLVSMINLSNASVNVVCVLSRKNIVPHPPPHTPPLESAPQLQLPSDFHFTVPPADR